MKGNTLMLSIVLMIVAALSFLIMISIVFDKSHGKDFNSMKLAEKKYRTIELYASTIENELKLVREKLATAKLRKEGSQPASTETTLNANHPTLPVSTLIESQSTAEHHQSSLGTTAVQTVQYLTHYLDKLPATSSNTISSISSHAEQDQAFHVIEQAYLAETPDALFLQDQQKFDPHFFTWKQPFLQRLACADTTSSTSQRIIYFHYHIRKAAGTTIRDIVKLSAQKSHGFYLENEGLVLKTEIFDQNPSKNRFSSFSFPPMFSITSLRHPISRILSLYWYEHVGWYYGILRQVEKCRPLDVWIAYWRDTSSTKQSFLQKNPGNNYVEIENYYTKAFSGWDGKQPVTEADYTKALHILTTQFSLVLLTEWMGDETQQDAVTALFPQGMSAHGQKVRGNMKMQALLKPRLLPANREAELIQELEKMNAYDIRLYKEMQRLLGFRLKYIPGLVKELKQHASQHGQPSSNQLHSQPASSSQQLLLEQQQHHHGHHLSYHHSSQQQQQQQQQHVVGVAYHNNNPALGFTQARSLRTVSSKQQHQQLHDQPSTQQPSVHQQQLQQQLLQTQTQLTETADEAQQSQRRQLQHDSNQQQLYECQITSTQAKNFMVTNRYKAYFNIHQPPGHKGPT